MAKSWCMVRLQRTTVVRLRQLADSLLAQHSAGKLELPNDQADHVSLDYLVNVLAGKVEGHRRRAKESNQRRRKGPKTAQTEGLNSP